MKTIYEPMTITQMRNLISITKKRLDTWMDLTEIHMSLDKRNEKVVELFDIICQLNIEILNRRNAKVKKILLGRR